MQNLIYCGSKQKWQVLEGFEAPPFKTQSLVSLRVYLSFVILKLYRKITTGNRKGYIKKRFNLSKPASFPCVSERLLLKGMPSKVFKLSKLMGG